MDKKQPANARPERVSPTVDPSLEAFEKFAAEIGGSCTFYFPVWGLRIATPVELETGVEFRPLLKRESAGLRSRSRGEPPKEVPDCALVLQRQVAKGRGQGATALPRSGELLTRFGDSLRLAGGWAFSIECAHVKLDRRSISPDIRRDLNYMTLSWPTLPLQLPEFPEIDAGGAVRLQEKWRRLSTAQPRRDGTCAWR